MTVYIVQLLRVCCSRVVAPLIRSADLLASGSRPSYLYVFRYNTVAELPSISSEKIRHVFCFVLRQTRIKHQAHSTYKLQRYRISSKSIIPSDIKVILVHNYVFIELETSVYLFCDKFIKLHDPDLLRAAPRHVHAFIYA